MIRRTGLALAGLTILVTACGSSPTAVRADESPVEASTDATTGLPPSPLSGVPDAVAGTTTPDAPIPPAEESPAGTSSTTTTTVAYTTPQTSTVESVPGSEIVLPALDDLDTLLNDVESALAGIDLSQTEGDLP